jgi:hypothetical protein
MDREEDSFDGSFPDNIRSPAYKAQWGNKKHKLVINVSGTPLLIQTPNMQSLNMFQKRTSGSCRLIPSPTSILTSAGLIITSSQIFSQECSRIRRSTTFQVCLYLFRNDHTFTQK